MRFKVIPVASPISALTGPTNCVVVWRNDTAVVVDPGGDAGSFNGGSWASDPTGLRTRIQIMSAGLRTCWRHILPPFGIIVQMRGG